MISQGQLQVLNEAASANGLYEKLAEVGESLLYDDAFEEQARADVENGYAEEGIGEARRNLQEQGFQAWDYEILVKTNAQARARLKELGEEVPGPTLFEAGFDPRELQGIPHLGTEEVGGFEYIEGLFVDASGFGATDEPALTFDQFRGEVQRLIREQNGQVWLAITEAGQFQVRVGAWRKADDVAQLSDEEGVAFTIRL